MQKMYFFFFLKPIYKGDESLFSGSLPLKSYNHLNKFAYKMTLSCENDMN